MTAVIYARYSSDNQREESIEGQIRECTAYAEKNGITIVKHYIDRAISAKTDNRPEFQQMIKDSDKKLFDIVLVWKLDRFARNRYDSARYKTQLKKNGVKLMSATEIISEGPEGIILESVLEGYAEYYSADLSEKVVRGMTENALKGKFTGGAIPFGYIINADHRFEIDPLTAPFVAETFQHRFQNDALRPLGDDLGGRHELDTVLFQLGLIPGTVVAIPGKTVELPDQHDIKQLFVAVFYHLLKLRAVVCLGRDGTVNVVLDDGDAVLFRIGRAFPDLTFDGFFALVVAGIASVDHCGHGRHLHLYIIERQYVHQNIVSYNVYTIT